MFVCVLVYVHRCVCMRVCVCQRSTKWIACKPRTDWAMGPKFGALEELLLLFRRDEFDWHWSCPKYLILSYIYIYIFFNSKMQINVNTLIHKNRGWLRLYLTRIDEVVLNLYFFHKFFQHSGSLVLNTIVLKFGIRLNCDFQIFSTT